MMGAMRTVQIRDDEIRLGQFLKLADLGAGEVAVNGRTETRRGRRLAKGDVVTVRGEEARVG
jgi:ribosome-associated protein